MLLWWWVRLHNLLQLPAFIDEGAHLQWARLVWRMQPFHGASDGKLLGIWLGAIFWPFAGGLWLLRVAGLLVGMCGFAALLATARRWLGARAAVAAAALLLVLPHAHFFERMAVADAVSPALLMLVLWSGLHALAGRRNRAAAVVCGALLAAAVLAKLSNLVFAAIPFLVALVWLRPAVGRSQLTALLQIYLAAFILLLPVWLALTLVDSDMGFDLLNRKGPHTLGETILESGKIMRSLPGSLAAYWTMPLFVLTSLLWVVGLAGRKRMALLCGFAAAAFLALVVTRSTDGMFESRYLLPMLPLLALLAGAGAEKLLGAASARAQPLLSIVALGAAVPAMQFVWLTWVAPQQLPLGAFPDRWEYITGWPSGFALRAAAAGLAARNTPLTVIAVDQGSWERMQAHLPYGSQVKAVVWPPKDWRNGSGPPGMQPDDLLLLDHPRDDAVPQQLSVGLSAVETYYRPQHESWVTLYRMRPAP
jgi:4-amino-4-deoxy-L-arabinose transferase-like glycosyltransferase